MQRDLSWMCFCRMKAASTGVILRAGISTRACLPASLISRNNSGEQKVFSQCEQGRGVLVPAYLPWQLQRWDTAALPRLCRSPLPARCLWQHKWISLREGTGKVPGREMRSPRCVNQKQPVELLEESGAARCQSSGTCPEAILPLLSTFTDF